MILDTMSKAKPVRQIDIARRLGVSRGLVASCLNNPDSGKRKYPVAPETERRIKEFAAQLGYRPSPTGRGLRTKKSYLVGVLNSGVNFGFHNELNAGIQHALAAHEYAPLSFTHLNAEEETHFLEMCRHRQVDGLLANCDVDARGAANARHLADWHAQGQPVVEMFGHFIPNAPAVTLDYQAIARLAVQTLLAKNCREVILYIHHQYRAGKKSGLFWTARELWQGYLAACQENGLSPKIITYDLPSTLTDEAGYYEGSLAAAKQFAARAPQRAGILGLHQLETEALLDVLHERFGSEMKAHTVCLGIHHRAFRYAQSLTLIPAPARQVGVAAAELLLRMMSDMEQDQHGKYADITIAPDWKP